MSNESLWKTVQEELKIAISPAVYKTLFYNTSLASVEHNIATIGCPSSYIKDLIERRYYSLIKDILDRQTKENNSLLFVVKIIAAPKQTEAGPLFSSVVNNIEKQNSHRLLSDFTFENFAVSSSNQLPFAAATAVAKNPGTAYNPLFLWGGVGVGKTHLMQAIAHEILKTQPHFRIICCPGEEFTNEIINAIRSKTTDQFKKKYRAAQLLLLDDVQFIAGKETVQEEFFHTFNALQREGGQVVLTSDKPPSEISKLEERLRSRFEAGLIVDIPPPDFELRTAILLIKSRQKGIDLPMDLAQTVAANFNETRKMEGFLTRLTTEAETRKIPISLELINSILGKTLIEKEGLSRNIHPKEVIEKVAEHYHIKVPQLKASTRVKEIVLPRQILMYLLRIEMKLPLEEVGEILGGRDHTTVMHGVDKITNLLRENEGLRVDISGIKQKLGQ